MAQQFIVEGKDGYILSALCERQGLPLPTGYVKRTYGDFVVSAGGVDKISTALEVALEDEDNTNVGVVIDANGKGVLSKTQRVRAIIRQIFPTFTEEIIPSQQGWHAHINEQLTAGVWVMPNNQDTGYLEHFLTSLIQPEDSNLLLARQHLENTVASGHASFSPVKEQKALLALFLAIQDEPGMNAQTAIAKGILDHGHPLAQNFLAWFANTFQLG